MVGVRVEFRAVGRADQTLSEAHGRQTFPVRGVRTVFRPVRSPGTAQETPSAQERSGRGAASAADGPSVVQRRVRPTPAETTTPAVDDVERRRDSARAKGRRRRCRIRRRRSAVSMQANGAGLVTGARSHVIISLSVMRSSAVLEETNGRKRTISRRGEGGISVSLFFHLCIFFFFRGISARKQAPVAAVAVDP